MVFGIGISQDPKQFHWLAVYCQPQNAIGHDNVLMITWLDIHRTCHRLTPHAAVPEKQFKPIMIC